MLLPEPLRPTTPKNSPGATSKSMSRRACCTSMLRRPPERVEDVALECPLAQVRAAGSPWRRRAPRSPVRATQASSAKYGDRRRKKTTDATTSTTTMPTGMRRTHGVPNACDDRHGLVGDQAVARVLDDLRHGVEEQVACAHVRGDHAQGIDDRRGVERRLQDDLPDVAEVAKAHEQRAEEEGQRHGERDQLDEEQRQPQDVDA